jgi:glucose/arabinose dehydrogenase
LLISHDYGFVEVPPQQNHILVYSGRRKFWHIFSALVFNSNGMRSIKILLIFLVALAALWLALRKSTQANAPSIKLVLVTKGLDSPVAMDFPKDNSGRLFICEQTGKIKIVSAGKIKDKTFLDVSKKLARINKVYSEKGLLGIAFHPSYKTNGRFFIYYSAPTTNKEFDHKSILAEYKVSADADVADAASEKIIMEIDQPQANHNGGQLTFGPDGFLYIGLGDGGGAGDEHGEKGNGQNLETLLGKILRIDINSKSPYAIPADNPFRSTPKAKPEIWAYGLRNPWRFSFDSKTGKLFCGDVGQEKWEEIDIIEKGKNYGWRIMEGNHCYKPAASCNETGIEKPIAEYGHSEGISITGGYVYHGKDIPQMEGNYIFGDWKGNLFFLEPSGKEWKLKQLLIDGKKNNDVGANVNSFGVDEKGEIYLLTQKVMGTVLDAGRLYRVAKI